MCPRTVDVLSQNEPGQENQHQERDERECDLGTKHQLDTQSVIVVRLCATEL